MELPPRQQAFLGLARSLFRLDRSMQAVVGPALRSELALEPRSAFVLAAIDRGATGPGAVAERLDLPPASVTRTVESLSGAGLVTRERHPGDRRHVELALTDAGRDVLARARSVLSGALAKAWPDLETRRAADLAQGLEDLVRTGGRRG